MGDESKNLLLTNAFTGLDLANALRVPDDPYYADFGRFIVGFASAEQTVRTLLLELLKLNNEEGAALFGNWQIKDFKEAIKKLFTARSEEVKYTEISDTLEQFTHISNVRNAIVHWGGYILHGDVFVASNRHKKFKKDTHQEYRVSKQHLSEMISDLIKIEIHLDYFAYGPDAYSARFVEKTIVPILASSWSYKPHQPTDPPRKSPADRK